MPHTESRNPITLEHPDIMPVIDTFSYYRSKDGRVFLVCDQQCKVAYNPLTQQNDFVEVLILQEWGVTERIERPKYEFQKLIKDNILVPFHPISEQYKF